MQKYILFGVILLALVGGYFIFPINFAVTTTDPEKAVGALPGATVQDSGEVVAVDLEGVMLDGPGLVTIQTPNETTYTIAVPSMGIRLCPSYEEIASPFTIEVGDRVEVRGTMNDERQIVPCEDVDDFLRVMRTYTNTGLGVAFEYPAGESGYVFEDDMVGFSEHPDFVYGIMLTDWQEYEAFHSATDAREGPPTIQLRVIENTENLTPAVWVDRNPMESNIALAFGEPQEAVVGGANAVTYLVDGLYAMRMYVVAHGEHIYLFVGSYLDADSAIARDFASLIDTVKFVPTARALNDGTHLGFIRSVSTDDMSLTFDVAIWLTGEAAKDAAIRAGLCTEATRNECTPNDYFIENQDEVAVPLPIDPNALIFMQTWRMEETGQVTEQEIGLGDFVALINDAEAHWSRLPYEVTILDGEVKRIEEVYVP